MRLAFAIVSLFPSGGLQRDCMAIAPLLAEQGHEVTIFTSRLTGDVGGDLAWRYCRCGRGPITGATPASRGRSSRRWAGQFDRIVGFDKLEGLDMLYCADPPAAPRYASGLTRFLPRGRKLIALERACFAPRGANETAAAEPAAGRCLPQSLEHASRAHHAAAADHQRGAAKAAIAQRRHTQMAARGDGRRRERRRCGSRSARSCA